MNKLKGGAQDALDMREVLTSRYGFPESQVLTLTDGSATREAILSGFRSHLIEKAKQHPDAVVVFQFSGHGAQVKDENGDEEDGTDDTIVPVNGRDPAGKNPDILDDELDELMGQLSLHTPNITFILDSTHRAVKPAARGASRTRLGTGSQLRRVASYVMMTACLPHETANETTRQMTGGKKYNGLFTYHLLKALRSATPAVTYRDLFEVVAAAVVTEQPDQHPQLEGNLRQRIFSDVASLEERSYISINSSAGNALELAAGSVHGVRVGGEVFIYHPDAKLLEGEENKLAAAIVTSVTPFTSVALLPEAVPIPPTAKAVLKRMGYQPTRLRLALDSAPSSADWARARFIRDVAARLKGNRLVELVNTRTGAAARWDLRLDDEAGAHGAKRLCLYHGATRLTVQDEWCVMPSESRSAAKIADAVEALARQRNVRELGNALAPFSDKVKLRAQRVVTNEDGQHREEGFIPTGQFFTTLRIGDRVRIQIENQSDRDLYVTLLDLGSGGNIAILHPFDGSSELVRAGESIKTGVLVITRPPGPEMLKVVASTTQIDLRLLQRTEKVRGGRPPSSPLEHLFAAAAGDAGARPTQVPSVEWTTAEMNLIILGEAKGTDARSGMSDNSAALVEVTRLYMEASGLMTEGKYKEALEKASGGLVLAEKTLGKDSPALGSQLILIGLIHLYDDNPTQAKPFIQRAIIIQERSLGPTHLDLSVTLTTLAMLYIKTGEYDEAEAAMNRALSIKLKILEPQDPTLADIYILLAGLKELKGDYETAEYNYQKALVILEKAREDNWKLARTLTGMARLYYLKKDYARAEELNKRVLNVAKSRGGQPFYEVYAFNNLGLIYSETGNYNEALVHYEQALAVSRAADSKTVSAEALTNIGNIYQRLGDDRKAISFYEQALAIAREVKDISDTASNLLLLGAASRNLGEHKRALNCANEALSLARSAGDKAVEVVALSHIAADYARQGQTDKALDFYKHMLELLPSVDASKLVYYRFNPSESINDIAAALKQAKQYAPAAATFKALIEIREKALGTDHPDVASLLKGLADVYLAQGDITQAVPLVERANASRTKHLNLLLSLPSAEERQAYLAEVAGETSYTISLNARMAPTNQAATRLALTTILQRKGRHLDILGDGTRSVRARLDQHGKQTLEELDEARAHLASLILRGSNRGQPATGEEFDRLELNVYRLEAALAARSAELRAAAEPATIERVQRALPPDAALVEFILYTPRGAESDAAAKPLPPRYAAYVLRQTGEPSVTDLGVASVLDAEILKLRAELTNPAGTNYKSLGRAVDQAVMAPLRPLLGQTRTLLVAPDGTLSLLAFAALVSPQGRHLIEDYSISYLTSGRDLLRPTTDSSRPPLIVADPDFDLRESEAGAAGQRQTEQLAGTFQSLPGTLEEANGLRRMLPNARTRRARSSPRHTPWPSAPTGNSLPSGAATT